MSSKKPFIAELLRRLSPRLKARLYLEPEQQRVGYIQFSNGRRCFFRDNRFDLNTLGAVNIARDKVFCSRMLRHFGYNTPTEISFWKPGRFRSAPFQRSVTDALTFANSVGFPVFIKPNDRSQGLEVSLVHDRRELRRAAARVFKVADVAIVQAACTGREYRIVMLDGEVISAYERIPLEVRADGSTIRQLIERKQKEFDRRGRDTTIKITSAMRQRLGRMGLTLRSRPRAGRVIRLLDIANLSLGGESKDVTTRIHPYYRELSQRIASDLNLRFCGIDLITANIAAPDPGYVILEINASPGLDHYALRNRARQKSLVDALYLRVLRRIESGPRDAKDGEHTA